MMSSPQLQILPEVIQYLGSAHRHVLSKTILFYYINIMVTE